MRHRLPSVALVLTTAAVVSLPPAASGQDSNSVNGQQLPGLPQAPIDPTPTPTPDAATASTPTEPGADAAAAPTPAPPQATDGTAAEPTTPVPPSYLVPAPSAQQQPISGVASLTDAEVPAEPLRIAAIAAALVAALIVGLLALLRALGLRTPVSEPFEAPVDGRLSRFGERIRGTADDMRDFLRRSR